MPTLTTQRFQALLDLISAEHPEFKEIKQQYLFAQQTVTWNPYHESIKFHHGESTPPLQSTNAHYMISMELQSTRHPITILFILYVTNHYIDISDLYVGENCPLPPMDDYFDGTTIAPWVKHKLTII